MRASTTSLGLLSLTALLYAGSVGLPALARPEPGSQQGAGVAPAPAPAAEDDLDAWVASLNAPGPHHRLLDAMVGRWTGAVRVWDSAEAEPETVTCRVERALVLGDRFLHERVTADLGGGPYEGFGLMGYNPADGRYEATWADNQSTVMSFQTGRVDRETRTLTMQGDYRDLASGFVISTRTELDLSDPDRHTLVGYATTEDGREFKTIEMDLQRVAPSAP